MIHTQIRLSFKDIFKRSIATFIAGAVASPLSSVVFELDLWVTMAIAGITSVVNLAGRLAQRWLSENPE